MKKFLCLVLALFLALASFVSCMKEENAYEVVSAAIEKNKSLDSYEAELKFDVKIAMQGLSLDVPIALNMKTKNVGRADEVSSAELVAKVFGFDMTMKMYMEDGWMYSDGVDGAYKEPVEEDSDSVDDVCDAILPILPAELFEKKTVKINKDGTKSVTVILSEEEFGIISEGLLGELYGEFFSGIMNGGSTDDYSFDDIEVTYNIGKDGYISCVEMSMCLDTKATLNVDSSIKTDAEIKMDVSMTYSNINGNVTPTPPKGYLDFKSLYSEEESETDSDGEDLYEVTVPEDTVPDSLNFSGENITFLVRGDNDLWKNEMDTVSVGQHSLFDAVYYRNMTVENELGVGIVQISAPGDYSNHKNWNSMLRNAVLTKSGDFDAAAIYASTGTALATEGMYYNVLDIPYLDLGQPWWNQSVTEGSKLFDTSYFLGGDIAYTQILNNVGVFYHTGLLERLYGRYDDIYKTVKNGEWTVDLMYDLAAGAWCDNDGNSILSKGDVIGFMPAEKTSNDWRNDAWIPALGINITKTVGGYQKLDLYNEHTLEAFEKVKRLYKNCPGTLESDGTLTKFKRSEQLFYIDTLGAGAELMSAVNDGCTFGILPMPKFDKAQSEYKTTFSDNCSLIAVLSTCDKTDALGATLELMASESYRQVRPVCYELCFGGIYRNNRDNSEMFDMLVDGAVFDFGFCYSQQSIGGVASIFRDIDADFVLKYEANKSKYESRLEELLDKLYEVK